MATFEYLDHARPLAVKALQNGGELQSSSGVVRWDISGACQRGYERTIHARPEKDRPARKQADGVGAVDPGKPANAVCIVHLVTPCRRCDGCREARQRLWRLRATAELGLAHRNWFGTLTLSPDSHSLLWDRARARNYARAVDIDTLGIADQWRIRVVECQAEITRWLKRVRKSDHTAFRYVVVAEAHQNGLPHFHCLIHQASDKSDVRHATLKGQWRLGFTNFKLVPPGDTRTAAYVAKYLSKSALARVRASIQYGSGEQAVGLRVSPEKSDLRREDQRSWSVGF